MKEINLKPDTSIEVKANMDQEKQTKYVGSITPKPGQKLYAYKFNTRFEDIFEVDLKDEKNFHFFEGTNNRIEKRITVLPDHLYACAINRKNAARKILAQFGFKFNVSGTSKVIDMPEEKLPPQFIEMGRTEGPIEKPNGFNDPEAKMIDLNPNKTTENE